MKRQSHFCLKKKKNELLFLKFVELWTNNVQCNIKS